MFHVSTINILWKIIKSKNFITLIINIRIVVKPIYGSAQSLKGGCPHFKKNSWNKAHLKLCKTNYVIENMALKYTYNFQNLELK